MQTLQGRRSRSEGGVRIGLLARELEEHWEELVRFVVSRRARSASFSAAPHELTATQVGALTALDGGDLRMGDLAARLGLAESSVTRLVDRLEALGLVQRRPSRPDRRSVLAGLTADGRRAVRHVRAERAELLRGILDALEEGEREEFVRLFGKVAEELRRRRLGVEVP